MEVSVNLAVRANAGKYGTVPHRGCATRSRTWAALRQLRQRGVWNRSTSPHQLAARCVERFHIRKPSGLSDAPGQGAVWNRSTFASRKHCRGRWPHVARSRYLRNQRKGVAVHCHLAFFDKRPNSPVDRTSGMHRRELAHHIRLSHRSCLQLRQYGLPDRAGASWGCRSSRRV